MIIVLTLINVALCGLSLWCLYMTASLSKEALNLIKKRVVEATTKDDNDTINKVKNGETIYPKYREYGDLS